MLTRKTLKRLTVVPAHKIKHDHRHFATVAPGIGERLPTMPSEAAASRPESAEAISVGPGGNERRKKHLIMSNLKRVFRALDLNGDGFIDVEDLDEAQRKIGGLLEKREVTDIIWEVDDDSDGRLSFGDYLTVYKRAQVCARN